MNEMRQLRRRDDATVPKLLTANFYSLNSNFVVNLGLCRELSRVGWTVVGDDADKVSRRAPMVEG